LAHFIAAESVVLLKNTRGVLPIGKVRPVRRIAVVGAASEAKPYDPNGVGQGKGEWNMGDVYSGGGSGHVAMSSIITPLQAITDRAQIAGIEVVSSPSNSTAGASLAAVGADLILVVGGCFGREMADRPNLNLDDNADNIIRSLAEAGHGPKTVVLMQVPGATLTPWRKNVAAILAMFPGGQATGPAWSDVLFGDRPPSGRLPVMMPASEQDVIEPGDGSTVRYSEGMKTSYRNPDFAAAYPFGHGLTYTNFEYLQATFEECGEEGGVVCIRCPVRNAGEVAARAVPQLYVEMPSEAGHPTYILKGFHKTSILPPKAFQDVVFRLTARDLSYYDEESQSWLQPATVTALVGESSRDIRLRLPVEVHGVSRFNFLWIILGLCALFAVAAVIWRVVRNSQGGLLNSCEGEDEESEEEYDSELEDSEAAVLNHTTAKDVPSGSRPQPL
jgi:beta-glucosidase